MASHRRALYHAITLTTAVLGLAGACNMKKMTADMTSGMLEYGSVSMDREADLEFARYAFPASMKTLETFLVSSPENEHLLILLARGYNSYAFAVLEGDLERARIEGPADRIDTLTRRAAMHYMRGSEYGFRLLGKPALRAAARKGDAATLDRELAALEKEDAPALFWAGYGWASAVNLQKEDPDVIADLTAVEKIMKRAYELDRDYNSGAPIVFHGVLNASKPPALGGKPAESKRYFDEAMKRWGDKNLLVPFLYARFYCPTVQDAKLFRDLMGKVLDADPTRHADLRLNNEVARERARFWVKHVDDLILE
jgi:hypothetical protein